MAIVEKEAFHRAIGKKNGGNKYRNTKVYVDGIKFDSRKEAQRYSYLKVMEHSGVIRQLKLQVVFPIVVNGVKICKYICDFQYDQRHGKDVYWFEPIVEDVKSEFTRKLPVYRIKKKLMKAIHGIEIREV